MLATTLTIFLEAIWAVVASLVLVPATFLFVGFLAVAGRRRDPPRRVDCANMPRIAYLRTDLWSMTWGGAATHIREFSRAAQGLGSEVQIITSQEIFDLEEVPQRVIKPPRTLAVLRDIQILAYNFTFTLKAIGYLRSIGNVDVIYHRYGAFSWCGAMLSFLLDIPLVLEFNSSEVWWAKNLENEFLVGLLRASERTALACSDFVATVSKVLNRDLVTAGVDADRVFDNPNGVDPARFPVILPGNSSTGGQIVVGFSGVFAHHHGVDRLIEAFDRAISEGAPLYLLLIGGGRLADWVMGLVRERKLGSRVSLTGIVPHREVPRYLLSCDVLVLPHPNMKDGSVFFGSPVKLFEYMVSGKAILSTDVGQMGRILQHRSTAFLVDPNSTLRITEGLVELSRNLSLRWRMGKRARKLALRRFTWEENARRVLERVCLGDG
jgi:glycosyltransferase involved in cell wall biosynthesis